MVTRMSVPLPLLGLLEREPSHGYDLKRDYDTFFGRGRPLPFGQVYSTLGRLARDGEVGISEGGAAGGGRVVVSGVGGGGGRDGKRYVIPAPGPPEVDAWLTQPVEPEPH